MKIRSHGHVLRSFVHPGEPGSVLIVLDDQGNELGRGVAVPTGNVIVHLDPPIPTPPKGRGYEVHRLPHSPAEAPARPRPLYVATMDAEVRDGA